MKSNYIVGHKNPDTDSVVSAIAYSEIKKSLHEDELFIPAVSGEINKETEYLLDRFGFDVPVVLPDVEKDIILVDHNEPGHRHENVKNDEVVAIFDHHKLDDISFSKPITIVTYPVGSTATVIAATAFEKNIKIDEKTAGILIGAIISDTLNLTSPTTTGTDRGVLKELNKISRIDTENLANNLFAAKSDISDITTEELIGKDYKVFEMTGKKVGIGVWETVLPDTVLERKSEIIEMLAKKKSTDGLDYIYFVVVDILGNGCVFVVLGDDEKNVAEAVFKQKSVGGLMKCPGVVSRKKQMTPEIEGYLNKK